MPTAVPADQRKMTVLSEPLVARQPIYDSRLRVVAYELLLQGSDGSPVADSSSHVAELGLSLVAEKLAYFPISRTFLLERYARALPSSRVILKVPRDLPLD